MKSFVSRSISATLMLRSVDLEAALDQLAGAGADHVARLGERHGRQAFAVEHEIERADQVGRGIDQRAVEIEYEGAGRGHAAFATGRGGIVQVAFVSWRWISPIQALLALFLPPKRR